MILLRNNELWKIVYGVTLTFFGQQIMLRSIYNFSPGIDIRLHCYL